MTEEEDSEVTEVRDRCTRETGAVRSAETLSQSSHSSPMKADLISFSAAIATKQNAET